MEEKEIQIIDEQTFKSKIYFIRNQKVMMDADLAEIYGYTTKDFNRQVKNNKEKFDDDFMFQLSNEETQNLRAKIPPQVGAVLATIHLHLQNKAFSPFSFFSFMSFLFFLFIFVFLSAF